MYDILIDIIIKEKDLNSLRIVQTNHTAVFGRKYAIISIESHLSKYSHGVELTYNDRHQ